MPFEGGREWIIDAYGCDPAALRSIDTLAAVFDRIVHDLRLQPVDAARFHQFPGEGGITGVVVLSESHLTCHTFPERGFAAFNLYCCRPRAAWTWNAGLVTALRATDVHVRCEWRGAGIPVPQ